VAAGLGSDDGSDQRAIESSLTAEVLSVPELALAVLIVANLALLPYLLLLLATALAAILARRSPHPEDAPQSRFLIVIPAHNEESGIAQTVASCRAADYPESLFSVVVIADNCADRTAAVAAGAGARVVERCDAARKSKGYAIESLIEKLVQSGEFDALDALVIVDADTTIDPGLLRSFDQDLRRGRDWIQCYYTVANPDESWRTRLLTYAFSLFNGVMPLGLNALGTSASFRGNGMCFSTRGLRRTPWRAYGLVEDIEYSWTIRVAGEWIAFEPAVSVAGAMVGSGGTAAAHQRRRWEFGRRDLRRRFLAPLLRSDRLAWWDKLVSACELTLLPMGALLSVSVFVLVLNLLAANAAAAREWSVARASLLGFSLLMALSVGGYALSPFWAMRLPWRYLITLAFFPLYVGWKFLVSLGGRPTAWIRTTRDPRAGGLG
jgi:cellulose synthase/poly-beta-1,6-N-acetylglucosamine synthase-like glycosyltransferase